MLRLLLTSALALGCTGTAARPDATATPDASPADAAPVTVRAATANIRCLVDDWDGRLELLAADLVAIDADLIGLQEVCRDAARDALPELLGAIENRGGPVYYTLRADTHLAWDQYQEGIALLSRWPLADATIVDLPPGAFPRKAAVARIAAPGGPIVAAATHLSFGAARADIRRQQLAEVRAAVDALRTAGEPAIIAGDLNETPTGAAITAAIAAGYADAWTAARPGDPGPTVPADAPVARIDYVLTRALTATAAARFLDTPSGALWPSDHLGVWADLIR